MNAASLKNVGFAPIRRCPKRLIASVQGLIKTGKTYLGFTAPQPIGYLAIEIGGEEGVVDQFIPEGMDENANIQVVRIRMDNPNLPNRAEYGNTKEDEKAYTEQVYEATQAVADEALYKFEQAYYESLKNMRTTIIDTGSDLWEIERLANFGRIEKIPQLGYTQLNNAMDKLIEDAFVYPGNLLITHHMKDKGETFTDDRGKQQWRATNNFQPQGYGGIGRKVQAVIETWREDLAEPDPVNDWLVCFHAEIIDSRHSPAAMGKKFDHDFTFADIAKSIVGGTDADWK